MNTNDLWDNLPGTNEMVADCEDPFTDALLKDTGKCKAKDTKKGKVKDTGKGKAKDTGKGKAKDTGKGKAKDTGKGKAKNMDFTNLFESDDAGDCEDPDTGKAKAKDMDSTNLFPRNAAGDVFYKLPPEEEPLLRGGSVKIQNCLFRFEDGFTPEVEVDYNDIDT